MPASKTKSKSNLPAKSEVGTFDDGGMSELPENYASIQLGEIASTSKERGDPTKFPDSPYVGLEHIEKDTAKLVGNGTASEVTSTKSVFREGDLLYGKLRPYLNKVWLAEFEGLCSTDILVFPKSKALDNKFLKYRFLTRDFVNYANANSSGVNLPRVNSKALGKFKIDLPPLPEQRRIVARIEELFSRLDAGVAALRHAKTQLQRYRQSVLAAAVTGQLPQKWREQQLNSDSSAGASAKVEPAEELLKQILKIRPTEWTGRGKYKIPKPPDTEGLPELPETWSWTNFETLAKAEKHALKAGPFGSALKKEFYVPSGYKIYGQEQVIKDDPYFGDYYIDEERFQSLKSCETRPGDFLISLVGTIGRTMIVPEDAEPGIINPRLVKMSLDLRLIDPRLLKVYLGSSRVKAFFKIVSHGGTMDVLNLTTLKALPIPLPPLAEIPRILDEVEARTTSIDHLESELDRQIARSNRLRQSTLAAAFAGRI